MSFFPRIRSAGRAAGVHLITSVVVAALAALLVFLLWYPFPYRELSGGRELFLLVISVDVVCGPLLTLVLFTPAKQRAELWRDLGMVALIQLGALSYGLSTVWQARPLYLVMEIDRFKVVAAPNLGEAAAPAFRAMPESLRPRLFSGPIAVAIREPKDAEEKQRILFESIQGGRDFAERPEFYLPYEGDAALKSLQRAKPLTQFLEKHPEQREAANKLAADQHADSSKWTYVPVIARQDWVALLNEKAQIVGYLKGDGF